MNKLSRDLGACQFTTYHLSREPLTGFIDGTSDRIKQRCHATWYECVPRPGRQFRWFVLLCVLLNSH